MNRKIMFCFLFSSLVFFGTAIPEQQISGRFTGKAERNMPAAPTCEIGDTILGNVVSTVNASYFNENTYWAASDPGQLVFTQKIIIKMVSGCPNFKQVYKFVYPAGYDGTTLVPFGVIDWGGGVCQGPAVVKVKSAAGNCTYFFNVIAE